MGFLSRSSPILRYEVRGNVEGSFWEVIDQGVRNGAFKTVESSSLEVGFGWVSIDDFTDNEFRGASYARGNYAALALRVDTVRVPARVIELNFKKESKKLLEETGRRRLSSSQRVELKDRLKEKLKTQVFPSIQVFDLIWDTAGAVAYFGSHSVKAREHVETHFKKSFGLTLVPLIPYLRAEQLLKDKAERQFLEKLKPSAMVS
ncbi:MAG: recombination-associated protein RdgC [Desulfomonile sp.]|jgi:DNA recombination-dependent growth factor C